MATLSLNVSHKLPALADNLIALQQGLNGDLMPLMEAIGSVLENSTRQRFADKQDPNGVAWASLAPATIKYKTNQQKTKQITQNGISASGILVERGDLFKSITSIADKNSVSVGTDRSYGIFHQLGIASRNLPARPFLGLSNDDMAEIDNLIYDYLGGLIHG